MSPLPELAWSIFGGDPPSGADLHIGPVQTNEQTDILRIIVRCVAAHSYIYMWSKYICTLLAIHQFVVDI